MTPTPKRFPFKAMGSFCEIQFFDESRSHAKNLFRQLLGEVTRLEEKYSRFREASLLNRINSSAGDKAGCPIDDETHALFMHALSCYEQSDGLFDVTSGTLHQIWDFKKAKVPEQAQIDAARACVGLHKIDIDNLKVRLPSGMQVDFGGIVKEYAADSAARLARTLGVEHGLVNLGGDFSVIGPQPNSRPWTVGITTPDTDASVMAKIDLLAGGLASSGDYERFFIHQGTRYSHILNPKTGWPSSGLRAVSVAANLCSVAGTVATIAMLKNESEAKLWLQDSGLAHVYMDSDALIGGAGLAPAN